MDANCVTGELGPREPFIHYYRKTFLEKKKKKKERKTFLGVGAHVVLVAKNLPASAGNIRDSGSIPGLGKLFGGGHGNPLQYYCLENPMDRGAWQAAVHRVAKNWT